MGFFYSAPGGARFQWVKVVCSASCYQLASESLPEPPEGLEYRNMETMEIHVWSVIAKRMEAWE